MKYLVSLIFCFSSFFTLCAQDAMDTIAEKTCSCLKQMNTNAAIEDMEAQLGICMFKEAGQYEDYFIKVQHLDISKLDDATGEELGKLIGTKMLMKCPDLMLKLANDADKKPKSDQVSSALTGKVTDMTTGQFITLSLKSATGPDQKFIWLTYFPGAELLKNGLSGIKGKNVELSYHEKEFYDPAIKDYRKYKVITNLSMK